MPAEPTRFRIAAQHYLRGRPPYSAALVRRVAQLCGLGPTHAVLDLGCGPGQLAMAFAPFASRVVGIDPEPEMLKVARAEAARAGLQIEFREGSSRDIGIGLGIFHLTVIGRAFHWMDRQETLARLDKIIEPGGAVVLFSIDHPKVPDNAWHDSYQKLVDGYAKDDPMHEVRGAPGWLSHEAVLLDSPFPYLERVAVVERRTTPLRSFVDRVLSLSSVSHNKPAERLKDVEHKVKHALAPFERENAIREVVESQALIAKREPA